MGRAHAWVIGTAAVLAPITAAAAPITADADPQGIYGGRPVDACAWPAAVWVGGCTASLVHPRMIVLAAHCVAHGYLTKATFGENFETPSRTVDLDGCVAHPEWGDFVGEGNHDIAICELAEAVEDVPIVPILMGCEAEMLQPGATAWLVGFGQADDELGLGPKREVETQIQQVGADAIWVGDDVHTACYGDSGGPAYLQLPDGSWRVFGATSGASSIDNSDCPQTGVWTMIHPYVPWIEETGIDITPCHDADGTWNPGEGCGAFPLAPGQGGGSWTEGCAGEASGMSASCGEAFDAGAGTTSGGESSSSSGGASDESTSAPDEGDASSEGGEGTTGDPIAGDESGSTTTPSAMEDDDSGCGCSSSPRREAPAFAVLSLLGLALARRRKR